MKAIQQHRWVEGTPAWERREVDRHLDSTERVLRSDFLESPLSLDEARERRRQGEPLEYILGHCHLADFTLEIDDSVLVPRPETETLLQRLLERLPRLPDGPVIDCGTGSGLLAIGIADRTDRSVVASDVSGNALRLARRNARCNDVRLTFVRCDRLKPFSGPFAAIVANLPYVLPSSSKLSESARTHEPHEALFVPEDPRTFYSDFLNQALACLHAEGELWFELDDELLESISIEPAVKKHGRKLTVQRDSADNLRFARIT